MSSPARPSDVAVLAEAAEVGPPADPPASRSGRTRWLRPGDARRLAGQTLAAAVLALLILVAVVWPAEFHRDPTGFGRATGLLALSAPRAQAPRYAAAYRSETIDIPLAFGQSTEFTFAMRQGETLVYDWRVIGPNAAGPDDPAVLAIGPGEPGPDRVYVDFHGASPPGSDPSRMLSYQRQDATRHARGALVAPFDGDHGWYLLNDSPGAVVVRLRLAGFYQRASAPPPAGAASPVSPTPTSKVESP